MMKMKKKMNELLIFDRDGVLNVNSKDPTSPYYYILRKEDLILKPGAKKVLANMATGSTVVLATRQKCISKGLITRAKVDEINQHLCSLLDFKFDKIYVQESGDDKRDVFCQILSDYREYEDVRLIDDSLNECQTAYSLGIRYFHTDDLLSLCHYD